MFSHPKRSPWTHRNPHANDSRQRAVRHANPAQSWLTAPKSRYVLTLQEKTKYSQLTPASRQRNASICIPRDIPNITQAGSSATWRSRGSQSGFRRRLINWCEQRLRLESRSARRREHQPRISGARPRGGDTSDGVVPRLPRDAWRSLFTPTAGSRRWRARPSATHVPTSLVSRASYSHSTLPLLCFVVPPTRPS
jgi:hypothetical protein